jgi:copper chaperone NosL
VAAVAMTIACMSGCGSEELSGPPTLNLGRDECVECNMIISDDRYAAGMHVLREGRREPLLFDDIGDMFDHERLNAELVVIDRYVHDQPSRAWIAAEAATYIYAENLATPMMSGLGAFTDPAAAKSKADELSGRVMNYEEARGFRKEWMEARHPR